MSNNFSNIRQDLNYTVQEFFCQYVESYVYPGHTVPQSAINECVNAVNAFFSNGYIQGRSVKVPQSFILNVINQCIQDELAEISSI